MSAHDGAEDWTHIDSWWDTFVAARSLPRTSQTIRQLDDRWLTGEWDHIDPLWETHIEQTSLLEADNLTVTLDTRIRDDVWSDLDPWWDSYSSIQQADVGELKALLEDCLESWARSDSRFDTDPLAADWTQHANTRGPLRPNQEENWSQWLAHLLRDAPSEVLTAIFEGRFDSEPETVQREVYLPDNDDSDRYADILVFAGEQGLSIEVKKNDEHYRKTFHTAKLVERQFSQEWTHILLLPKYKESALKQSVETAFDTGENGQPLLRSNQSPPIHVVYWQDVSSALRQVLREGWVTDPHWEASAYLFCTLIEQKLLKFIPYPIVDLLAASDDVLHGPGSLSVATGGVEEQISYLRDVRDDQA